MIDFDFLDEQYGDLPQRQSVRPSTKPIGSLTDHRRKVRSQRDGAYKRLREIKYGGDQAYAILLNF